MKLNIAHSEFPEQQGGLMICGYEWGGGDQGEDGDPVDQEAICSFANKHLRYGPVALTWRYDNVIKKWFAMWGRQLNNDDPGDFEKSIVQTNWCDTQNPRMNGDYSSLWQARQVENFIEHVKHFSPNLILFMGSKLIEALQFPSTLERFEAVMGKCTRPLKFVQMPSSHKRFKISFQTFERCDVVCFPHPSASRGLSDSYMRLFEEEMAARFADYGLARMYTRQAPGLQPNSRRPIPQG